MGFWKSENLHTCACGTMIVGSIARIKEYQARLSDKNAYGTDEAFTLDREALKEEKRWSKHLDLQHRAYCLDDSAAFRLLEP